MAYRNYSTAVSHIVDATGQGDFTTIGAALTAASSGQTIFIRSGNYVENLTGKSGVNLVAFASDAFQSNVTITGKFTFTGTGAISLSGIRLQTNSDFFLVVSGSNASSVALINCYLACVNNTGISFTSSNASSSIVAYYCQGNVATTGITLYNSSSSGLIEMVYTGISNTGNSTTASNTSVSLADHFYSIFAIPLSASSTGNVNMTNCFVDTVPCDAVCLALTGSGTSNLQGCSLASNTKEVITVGSGTICNTNALIAGTGAANIVTGAGTFTYSMVEQGGTPGNINASVNTGIVANAGLLRAKSISFDNGTNLLSNFVDWTSWTPTLTGQSTAGTTTYTTQVGTYTRIGNLAICQFNIVITAATGTGTLQIGGFPFTINSLSGYAAISAAQITGAAYTWPASVTSAIFSPTPGSTIGVFVGQGAAVAPGTAFQMQNTAMTAKATVIYRI